MKTPLWKMFLLGKNIPLEKFFRYRKEYPLPAIHEELIVALSDEKYCDNFGESCTDFITNAFHWEPTPEGHDYWSDISMSWYIFLKKHS